MLVTQSGLPHPAKRGRRDRAEACPLTVEHLVRETHSILTNCGVAASRSKISRIVRTYMSRVERNGLPFAEFVANNVLMTVMQRRVVAGELTKIITYADPTGETAVFNVSRGSSRE